MYTEYKTIGNTTTTIKGKDKKSYQCWSNMLKRCYNKNVHNKQPTYKDCSVCNEWLCYANFEKWYDENYYEIEGERTELDKDILFKGNKVYSPITCIFVPQRINTLFTKSNRKRGKYPIGVVLLHKNKIKPNRYKAECKINGKLFHVGTYASISEAFQAYKQYKEKEIKRIADEYKNKIPQKLYDALYAYEVEITD